MPIILGIVMPEGFDHGQSSIEELSERELTWGYWYVTHREQLQRMLVIALITLSVILYGYAFYRVIHIYAFEQEEYARSLATATQDYIDYAGIRQLNQIQPVQVIARQIIPGTGGNVDVVARVRNPNTKWALKSFTYRFGVGTAILDEERSFLLPGEEKFLMALNVKASAAGNPQVLVDHEQWQRVIQYETWGPERLSFAISEKSFTPSRQGEISDQLQLSEVTAKLTNDTAYNYNELEVQVALYSGTRLTAVNRVTLPDVRSGESREIAARFFGSLPSVSSVELIPTVNILDQASYRDFEGEFDPAFLEIEPRF